ncbi:alpha-ketoglutarate-dependent dioxygenase AlkB [Kiloniella laminariae]|uniref:Alpha-ketoglutarate-dependent dioxygenase AlkB n=1 Tax=Kiloniella laminariae TaxID=454162 RepID=A0ABT4LJG4_9PROT|nr:alpha-ketoglutarate-dependent dioxygenase AlkB [Kiloniella laminariae]MCZ4281246.1 alpha-ketoglutarate-dependent dioxygenase AlkB [Kiloniella laminariae]
MIEGFRYLPELLNRDEQEQLLAELRVKIRKSPLFQPKMPGSGRPFSVQMTNFGPLGWVSDKDHGYRYQANHPVTHNPWMPIPDKLLQIWKQHARYPAPPECCLLNHYHNEKAKMGLHRDENEQDFSAPVLSVSLGDTAVFRLGGTNRKDPTSSLKLVSGDVIILAGEARNAYHGIDRILYGSSQLLKNGGRINLTLRRVTYPGEDSRKGPSSSG